MQLQRSRLDQPSREGYQYVLEQVENAPWIQSTLLSKHKNTVTPTGARPALQSHKNTVTPTGARPALQSQSVASSTHFTEQSLALQFPGKFPGNFQGTSSRDVASSAHFTEQSLALKFPGKFPGNFQATSSGDGNASRQMSQAPAGNVPPMMGAPPGVSSSSAQAASESAAKSIPRNKWLKAFEKAKKDGLIPEQKGNGTSSRFLGVVLQAHMKMKAHLGCESVAMISRCLANQLRGGNVDEQDDDGNKAKVSLGPSEVQCYEFAHKALEACNTLRDGGKDGDDKRHSNWVRPPLFTEKHNIRPFDVYLASPHRSRSASPQPTYLRSDDPVEACEAIADELRRDRLEFVPRNSASREKMASEDFDVAAYHSSWQPGTKGRTSRHIHRYVDRKFGKSQRRRCAGETGESEQRAIHPLQKSPRSKRVHEEDERNSEESSMGNVSQNELMELMRDAGIDEQLDFAAFCLEQELAELQKENRILRQRREMYAADPYYEHMMSLVSPFTGLNQVAEQQAPPAQYIKGLVGFLGVDQQQRPAQVPPLPLSGVQKSCVSGLVDFLGTPRQDPREACVSGWVDFLGTPRQDPWT